MPAPKKQPSHKHVPSAKSVAAADKQPVKAKPQVSKGPFHFSGVKFNWIFILSVIGLCFVLYGNSIPNEFALDDEFVLHNDSTVAKGFKGIPQLFQKRYAWDQKGGYGYRPFVKVTFAMEYAVFGDSPHWGHFLNILLYALVCIVLFFFLRRLLYQQVSDYFLFIALALFITHPLHSEVVASLKNRDELLVLLFGLLSCYAMLKWFEAGDWKKRAGWGISGCIALGIGALSKADAMVFIPITAMMLLFFLKGDLVHRLYGAIESILMLTITLLVGYNIFHKHVLPPSSYKRTFVYIENPLVGVHWYHKFPLAFSTVWFYFWKLVFPKDLVCYYGYNAFDSFPHWTDAAVIAGIVLTIGMAYLMIKNRGWNPVLFFFLFLLGTFFPYTDIFAVGAGIVAERFMFIPSVAFVVLCTYLLFYALKLPLDKKLSGKAATNAYIIISVICVLFTIRVMVRNPDWKTHQSIYLHDSKVAPNSAKLQSLLAATYIDQAQKLKVSDPSQRARIDSLYHAGQQGYQNSVDIYPGYGTSLNNLGMIQYTLYGNLRGAITFFRRALAVDSEYSEALFNLGAVYEAIGTKTKDTIISLRRDSAEIAHSKEKRQELQAISMRLAGCEKRVHDDFVESENDYHHTIRLKPTYYVAYIYLSRLYFTEGAFQKVIDFDVQAINKGYKSDVVYVTMGNAYLMMKDTAQTVVCYEESMKYYDKNNYICGFLGKYYMQHGNPQRAHYYRGKYDTAMMFKNAHTPVR